MHIDKPILFERINFFLFFAVYSPCCNSSIFFTCFVNKCWPRFHTSISIWLVFVFCVGIVGRFLDALASVLMGSHLACFIRFRVTPLILIVIFSFLACQNGHCFQLLLDCLYLTALKSLDILLLRCGVSARQRGKSDVLSFASYFTTFFYPYSAVYLITWCCVVYIINVCRVVLLSLLKLISQLTSASTTLLYEYVLFRDVPTLCVIIFHYIGTHYTIFGTYIEHTFNLHLILLGTWTGAIGTRYRFEHEFMIRILRTS